MIVRVVRMVFKEKNIKDFVQLFSQTSNKIAEMKGCKHLELLKDASNPSIFYTYSIWEEETDLENYRNSKTFKAIWGECKKYFSDKPLAFSMEKQLLVKAFPVQSPSH